MGEFDWAKRIVKSNEISASTVRLLVYGPPGAGKTYLMGSFPGLFVLDTDRGLRTLKDRNIPSIPLETGAETWKEMIDLMKKIKDRSAPFDKFAIKTLGIDSITQLAKFLLEDAMARPPAGMTPRARTSFKPEWDHYDLVATRLEKIINRARDLGLNVVATCGVKIDKDDVSGTFLGQPDIVGAYRNRVGHDFDEYFYMEPETAQNKTTWYAFTSKYKYYQAKSRDGRMGRLTMPTYETLYGKGK